MSRYASKAQKRTMHACLRILGSIFSEEVMEALPFVTAILVPFISKSWCQFSHLLARPLQFFRVIEVLLFCQEGPDSKLIANDEKPLNHVFELHSCHACPGGCKNWRGSMYSITLTSSYTWIVIVTSSLYKVMDSTFAVIFGVCLGSLLQPSLTLSENCTRIKGQPPCVCKTSKGIIDLTPLSMKGTAR